MQYVIMRRAVLMEDEGREHLVAVANSAKERDAVLAKYEKPTSYFKPGDFYVIEKEERNMARVFEIKCEQKGCQHQARALTLALAKQGMKIHVGKVHKGERIAESGAVPFGRVFAPQELHEEEEEGKEKPGEQGNPAPALPRVIEGDLLPRVNGNYTREEKMIALLEASILLHRVAPAEADVLYLMAREIREGK